MYYRVNEENYTNNDAILGNSQIINHVVRSIETLNLSRHSAPREY